MVKPSHDTPSSSSSRRQLVVLPVVDVVIFPRTVIPLYVGREQSMLAVDHAYRTHTPVFVALQKDTRQDQVKSAGDLHTIGVCCEIVQMFRMPDGTIKGLFEGSQRASLESLSFQKGIPVWVSAYTQQVTYVDEDGEVKVPSAADTLDKDE